MPVQWKGTRFKGVRYYEHSTRKHGVSKDRYFAIRYQKDGKRIEEGIGWTSERDPKDKKNWTAEKAALVLAELKGAARGLIEGPSSLAEKREKATAEKKLQQAEKERLEKENITFGCFMTETYLPQCQRDKKEKTYTNEEGLYRLHLEGTIGNLSFSEISAFHLERIKKDMADHNLSNRTIQYVLQLTRQAFHVARKLGVYAGDSPTRNVRWPKLDNMKLRYLTAEQAEILLKALAEKSKTLHDASLLSLHCGLRFGEIAALKWSCVNWDVGTLAILNAKAGSRIAYLTDRAKEMLEQRKHNIDDNLKKDKPDNGKPKITDELIFKKRSGSEGPMAQASKVFSDVVDSLKLNEGITDSKQKITFHSLRHSYATHLYESTHDLYLTQRSLGHASGEMTKRYAKMNESRLREGAEAIEKALAVSGKAKKKQQQAANSSK